MKYFVARGVRRFDMGIGDYLKRGFGVEDVPLYDLIVARDLSALPGALFHRLKGRLRQNKLAREPFTSVSGRICSAERRPRSRLSP